MSQSYKDIYDKTSTQNNYSVGIPAMLCNSFQNRSKVSGKKSKCYEPISKIKKNQIVLEIDRVYWKGKVFDWFNKLSIEDRVIACKTIDKNLTSMLIMLYKRIDDVSNCEIAFKSTHSTISESEMFSEDDIYVRKVHSMKYHEFTQDRFKNLARK